VILSVVSPFVDKQHGTERVLAEVLERLSSDHGVAVHLYAQRVSDLAAALPPGSSRDDSANGRIFWRRVSAIPGPHLLQFGWWYFANRFARWRDAKFRGLRPDLLYSPGINAPDADAITVHIVFHAFYEEVRPQLRLSGNSPRVWPRMIHRLFYYRLIMALERRIYSNRNISLSAVSQLVAGQLKRFFSRDDVLVIRNAVDAKQFNANVRLARRDASRSQLHISAGEFVFLLIGNDWKKKGLDALLSALADCGDQSIRLLIVGKDDRGSYREQCVALKLSERVQFLDPSPDVLQFYAAADAYAGPSLEDAYGLPVLEAMACGLPVISSIASGVSEIINDGENGLLLRDPRDAPLLAQLLLRIRTSPEFARTLGTAAEKTAAAESWEAHAAKTFEHFQQVLARKRALSTQHTSR